MTKNQFYKDTVTAIVGIMLAILLCRYTLGGFAIAIAFTGLSAALMRKPIITTICFILFPLMVVFNSTIMGLTGITLLVARFTFVMMVAAAILSGMGSAKAQEKLPIGWMSLYLVAAALSSIDGWMPLISYLKIFNFATMLVGLYLLAKQMQSSLSCLMALRAVFMGISLIMIVGSIISYFIPSIGYSMIILKNEALGHYVTAQELLSSGSMILFCGMTSHSQMLSPVVSCLACWVLCDMLLVERQVSLLHCLILVCVPILLYLSRSRGGLLILVCVVLMVIFIIIPKAKLAVQTRRHMMKIFLASTVILVVVGVYFQIKNDAISRWLRKTDDISSDTRSLKEALTDSRQFLLDENLRDFKLNPVLGKGFQVVNGMKEAYDANMITWYTASVEKGVTPYVVLGETGLLGAFAFIVFLCSFYGACFRRGYLSLMTNFTCFFVANLADSTFFSPSGLGGFMWLVACIGAFSTDCLAKQLGRMQQYDEYRVVRW